MSEDNTKVVEVAEEQKPSNKMPRYSISFTKKNVQQLSEIQEELGLASMSETIRACVHATYSKTFPNYTRQGTAMKQVDEETGNKLSKTEIKQRKDAQEKANRIATAINVCENELGGVVATDENDNPIMCAYYQYDGRRRWKQEVDIESVNPSLVETQYLPNKDRVLQLQKDGNVDYNPEETIEQELGLE